ncbi:MAG: TraM recognition domain-containing protein, partial [Elusimicrobia bacterium]|nr:TraM recognition domain-containing protein [Elusimicrobiota bacterium]
VDEFNCFAFDAFGDFMSKCGGAGFALTLAHQSLGQLNRRGEHFKDEILDNANIKIILRQDSPDTIDEFARMIGTHDRIEYTAQVEESLLAGKKDTGMGSRRLVESFNIGPNVIRQLQPYQAAFLIKQPFLYDVVQMGVYDRVELGADAVDTMLPVKSHSSEEPCGAGIALRQEQRQMTGSGVWA